MHTQYDYLPNVGWLQYVENRKQEPNPGQNVISSYKYYSGIDTNMGNKNDLVGNRTYMEYADGSYVEYSYDPLYRLESETRKSSGGIQQAKYDFTYDLAGNRKTQSRYSTTGNWASYHSYVYNNANQLIKEKQYNQSGGIQNEETQYLYNDLGNLIEKNIENTDFDDPDNLEYNDMQWDYAYDAYSRLIDVDKDSNNVGDYTFNMSGWK